MVEVGKTSVCLPHVGAQKMIWEGEIPRRVKLEGGS